VKFNLPQLGGLGLQGDIEPLQVHKPCS